MVTWSLGHFYTHSFQHFHLVMLLIKFVNVFFIHTSGFYSFIRLLSFIDLFIPFLAVACYLLAYSLNFTVNHLFTHLFTFLLTYSNFYNFFYYFNHFYISSILILHHTSLCYNLFHYSLVHLVTHLFTHSFNSPTQKCFYLLILFYYSLLNLFNFFSVSPLITIYIVCLLIGSLYYSLLIHSSFSFTYCFIHSLVCSCFINF